MNISALLLATAIAAAPGDGLFEPGLVSDNGVFGFTLSPDGQHALWVQSGGARTRLVIVESHKVGGKWQAPKPVPFSATGGSRDIDPAFAPDGKSIMQDQDAVVPAGVYHGWLDFADIGRGRGVPLVDVAFAIGGHGWTSAFHRTEINAEYLASIMEQLESGFLRAS